MNCIPLDESDYSKLADGRSLENTYDKGLVWFWQFKTQCFQCLFLLRSNLSILIFTVKHMAFVDVRRTFIQMQGPIQNVNVFAETLMELIHKFCGDLKMSVMLKLVEVYGFGIFTILEVKISRF